MKKYLIVLFLVVLIAPSIALASWWNPLSWKIFQKKEPVTQVKVETQKTSEEKINELQKQLDELKGEQAFPELTPEVKKAVPAIDNPAKIKAETQAKLKAELKLKAEQEALVKEAIQTKIDAELKMKAEQDALTAKQKAEEQTKIDEQNEARLEAEREKEAKLNAINLKIANLGEKYLKDRAEMELNKNGMSSLGLNSSLNDLYNKYENDYNALVIEYHIIKYSN
jgi:membrane protein involved in colicin uptake